MAEIYLPEMPQGLYENTVEALSTISITEQNGDFCLDPRYHDEEFPAKTLTQINKCQRWFLDNTISGDRRRRLYVTNNGTAEIDNREVHTDGSFPWTRVTSAWTISRAGKF